MKKKQAIKKINNWAKDWEGSMISTGEFAEELLEFLNEELGMLPPPKDGTVSVIDNEDGSVTIPLWEWE